MDKEINADKMTLVKERIRNGIYLNKNDEITENIRRSMFYGIQINSTAYH